MAVDSGTYTDATLASRRRLAEAMMQKGTDTSPIGSHWQGLARLANSVMGGLSLHKLGQEEKSQNEQATASLMSLPGLGGGFTTAPVPGTPMDRSPALPSGDTKIPASIRTNNPGAMWPGPSSQKFGSTGHEDIAGGNKIAVFPDATSGAAAQFDLLGRKYAGKPLSEAIRVWSGGNNVPEYVQRVSAATGLAPNTIITPELLRSPQGIALARAMAGHEAGPQSPLSGDQWGEAQRMAFMDPATEGGLPMAPQGAPGAQPVPPMAPQQVAQAPGQTMTDAAPDAAQIKALIANPRTRAIGLQMYQQWRAQQTKQDAPTDDIREYRFDMAQRMQSGQKPVSFQEWVAAKRNASAPKSGLTPHYARDKDGKLKPFVLRNDATVEFPDLGPGMEAIGPGGIAEQRAMGTARGEAKDKLAKIESDANTTIKYIEDIEKDPYLSRVIGPYDGRTPNFFNRGTQAKIDQLTGRGFLAAFESLKGGGQITEIEGQKATQALTRLQEQGMSEGEYMKALADFKQEIRNLVAVAKKKAAGHQPGSTRQGPAGPAADPLGIR